MVLYSGKVHSIDDVPGINEFPNGSVFVINRDLAERIANENDDDFILDIEIRCLKEEAKDEDTESGVSESEE